MSAKVQVIRNLYQILDLEPGCSHNDVLHAYNRSKRAYDVDSLATYSLIEDEDKESILQEIENAFAILGHPAKRREYDLAHGYAKFSEKEKAQNSKAKLKVIQKKSSQKKEALKERELDPAMERLIDEGGEHSGSFLRRLREYRSLNHKQLADICKLSSFLIEAIESEDKSILDYQPVYLRGHIFMMCQALELSEPAKFASEFLKKLRS